MPVCQLKSHWCSQSSDHQFFYRKAMQREGYAISIVCKGNVCTWVPILYSSPSSKLLPDPLKNVAWWKNHSLFIISSDDWTTHLPFCWMPMEQENKIITKCNCQFCSNLWSCSEIISSRGSFKERKQCYMWKTSQDHHYVVTCVQDSGQPLPCEK